MIGHFAESAYWKKKVKVTSALKWGTLGQPDSFHYKFCKKHSFTLVTLDRDFDNDQDYPFTAGQMPGIIMLRANSCDVRQIQDILTRVLRFLTWIPFPRSFLTETKFVAGRDNVLMRGRDARTKEIKALQVKAGATTMREIRAFFHW